MEPIDIPIHLDEPRIFLVFSADQFVVITIGLFFGLVMRELVVMTCLSIGIAWLMRKFRESVPDGFLAHALYWFTGLPLPGKTVFNPFIRRFVG